MKKQFTYTNKRETLTTIGVAAGNWRRNLHIRQQTIADDVGTSFSNISAFERGLNDSAVILTWYLIHGFDPLEDSTVWQLLKN